MVDSAFDDKWKLEVDEKVVGYSKQTLKDLNLERTKKHLKNEQRNRDDAAKNS